MSNINGVFYKSCNDISSNYLIEYIIGRYKGNALVKIYNIPIPTEGVNIGDNISMFKCDCKWVAEVDLCNKYFSPKFNNDLQLYYCDKEFYRKEDKTNSIESIMDAIMFAIRYGLKLGNINVY